ncbi:unnamed protein product [Amoebophrya sp. A25]|nr:unnamed protein product [Amoebophrya sp. A25]|eukprot:GSA25T00025966001.1
MSTSSNAASPGQEAAVVIPYTAMIMYNAQNNGHTTYHIRVMSPVGQSWELVKRYSHFHELHEFLKQKYPTQLPAFPGKRLFGNNDPTFVQQRQAQLQQYLNAVLLLEPTCRTRVVAHFLGIEPRTPQSPPNTPPGDLVGGVPEFPLEEWPENPIDGLPNVAAPPAPPQQKPGADDGALTEPTSTESLASTTSVAAAAPGTPSDAPAPAPASPVPVQLMNADDPSSWGHVESNTGQGAMEEQLETLVGHAALHFLDLGQAPACVDQMEIDFRRKRYEELANVFRQQTVNGSPNLTKDVTDPALSEFMRALQPDSSIIDPEKLVVGFPASDEVAPPVEAS